MDPQKNPQTPTQDDDQRPAALHMPADSDSPEVTVDFSQTAPGAAPAAQTDGGSTDMPSLGVEPAAPAAGVPAGAQTAAGNDPFGTSQAPANDPNGAANGMPPVAAGPGIPGMGATDPAQAQAPLQDPYASPNSATQMPVADQPLSSFPGPSDPGAVNPPSSQNQSFGAPADQQSPVPPTAPVSSVKADKKTIAILGVVAMVLIAAISILVFM
jgi:hypothetical protein